jgi:hypothetical protein
MRYEQILRHYNVQLSRDIIKLISDETQRIQKHHPQAISCSVTLTRPHRRHHKGDGVRAQVSVALPGRHLVSTKEAGGHSESENALTALFNAFDAAERLAHTYLDRRYAGKTRRSHVAPVPA